jgi:hypothetical protein
VIDEIDARYQPDELVAIDNQRHLVLLKYGN